MTSDPPRRPRWAHLPLLATVCLAGCGGTTKVSCHGDVTYAGTPVEQGTIGFCAADGRSEGAVIENGRYRIEVAPGTYRVEIRGSRPVVGFKGPSDLGVPREDFIPEQFNAKTTLSVDVAPGGPQAIPFDLVPADKPRS